MTVQQLVPLAAASDIRNLAVFEPCEGSIAFFDERTVALLNAVSRCLLKDSRLRGNAAVTALAFWLRKANIDQMAAANRHMVERADCVVAPQGLVFHVCPSNVDTIPFYSLALALLTGNRNLVRISTKTRLDALGPVLEAFNQVIGDPAYSLFKYYVAFVQYGHENDINNFCSAQADARIIWGGDGAVATFKQFPTKPRVKDFFFADRISVSVFGGRSFLEATDAEQQKVVSSFFNDSYSFDQLGCSTAQTIFCLGSPAECEAFKNKLYDQLLIQATKYEAEYEYLASLKLNQQVADAVRTSGAVRFLNKENSLTFAEHGATQELRHGCGGGYFYFQGITQLTDLIPLISAKVQTLSYYGIDKGLLADFVGRLNGRGVDRVVPVGKALDFNYIWDGYNLIDELTKKVYVDLH